MWLWLWLWRRVVHDLSHLTGEYPSFMICDFEMKFNLLKRQKIAEKKIEKRFHFAFWWYFKINIHTWTIRSISKLLWSINSIYGWCDALRTFLPEKMLELCNKQSQSMSNFMLNVTRTKFEIDLDIFSFFRCEMSTTCWHTATTTKLVLTFPTSKTL